MNKFLVTTDEPSKNRIFYSFHQAYEYMIKQENENNPCIIFDANDTNCKCYGKLFKKMYR